MTYQKETKVLISHFHTPKSYILDIFIFQYNVISTLEGIVYLFVQETFSEFIVYLWNEYSYYLRKLIQLVSF